MYIINSLGEKKYILDTGMIVNKDNSIENIFEKEILITSEISGELYYEITHTDKPMLDNWKLNIEQEHQPVFNPIPLYDIKSVND